MLETLEVKEVKRSKNEAGTFTFKDPSTNELRASLLTKEFFRVVNRDYILLLTGGIEPKDILDEVIQKLSSSLHPDKANEIFVTNGGRKNIEGWLRHLSKLGKYQNGIKETNEKVIDLYLKYNKECK